MTTRQKQKLLDLWEAAYIKHPRDRQELGKLIGAMGWIDLPLLTQGKILAAKNYDEAKILIWRL